MGAKKMTSIGQPVPELPVADVERAQQHYRDALGFEIGWLYPGKEIGAVSRGDVGIFFRKRTLPFEPAVHWVFAEDIDASYHDEPNTEEQGSEQRAGKISPHQKPKSAKLGFCAGTWLTGWGSSLNVTLSC